MIKGFTYMAVATVIILIYSFFVQQAKIRGNPTEILIGVCGTCIVLLVAFIALVLKKINFEYDFGEKIIILKQGVLARSERQVFYGRIQNISISQDIFDKILGIASLAIETASDSGGAVLVTESKSNMGFGWFKLGFYSNSISIPGLLYEQALELKKFIMEQIKANPIDDAQSGL
jgi:uncharacterized membrane protein YdbT with pleckstrin-like domain